MNVSCRRFNASMATKNVSLFKVPHTNPSGPKVFVLLAHILIQKNALESGIFIIMSFVKKI
jgi:hypothetical protein